jgi:hypothetical protein
MPAGDEFRTKKRWYFYITDRGAVFLFWKLMAMPRLGPALRLVFRLGVVLAVLLLLYIMRLPFAPSDWVEVTVRNVPKGLRQIYLIADRREGVRALNTYHAKVAAFTEDPRRGGQGWYSNSPEGERFGEKQWPNAHRYGALAQRPDGTWELWWLGPADLDGPSVFRYIVGGGKAEIRLPDESRAVTPSPELLKQVGLPDASTGP